MKAETFLQYAMRECARGKRTEDALNFDEKLLEVAKFYNKPLSVDMLINPVPKPDEYSKAYWIMRSQDQEFDSKLYKKEERKWKQAEQKLLFEKSEVISSDVFPNLIKLWLEKRITIDEFVSHITRAGNTLIWKKEIIEKHFS